MDYKMEKDAFDISTDSVNAYLTVMDGKELFRISKISRATNENHDKGFQRHLSEIRAKNIAKYIDDGFVIPGSIILSAQSNAELSYSNGKIKFSDNDDSFFVIDGQHRLYGLHYATTDLKIPVFIFNDLKLEDEIQYFLDVNSTQRGVPKTLRIELTRFLTEPESLDDIRLKIIDLLNTDDESPLKNRISKLQTQSGKLTHVTLQKAFDPMLETNLVKNLNSVNNKFQLIKNFLIGFEQILISNTGSSDTLSTTTVFLAIFRKFSEYCELCILNYGNYKASSFTELFSQLGSFDFSSYKGSGNKVVTDLANDMFDQINTNFIGKNDDHLF